MSEKKAITTNENGDLDLTTIEARMGFATRLMQEGMISSSFKTPQQVLIGMEYANALGVRPVVALNQMYVINGKPCLFGDGPLMLIQATGEMDSIKEFFIDEDCNEICVRNKNLKNKIYGAVTQVKRKGDPEAQEDSFTLDDLDNAQMHLTKYGEKDVWKKYKRNMMRYKARSMALKSKFADLLNGINISEYSDHFSPETPTVNNPDQTKIDVESVSDDLKGNIEDKTADIEIKDYTTIDKNPEPLKTSPKTVAKVPKAEPVIKEQPEKTKDQRNQTPSFKLEV